MDSFWEKRKKSKNGCFLAIFGLILTMFLTSQPYDFDAFAHAGAPLGVECCAKFRENRMDSFWEIWNFHEKVGSKKKKTARLHK